jgi:hypothetical protein
MDVRRRFRRDIFWSLSWRCRFGRSIGAGVLLLHPLFKRSLFGYLGGGAAGEQPDCEKASSDFDDHVLAMFKRAEERFRRRSL